MKTLLTVLTVFFTVMFSPPSYAEWTKVGENISGDTYYVDFERIRKVDGYVYWWELGDYLKPNKNGILSAKVYNQGDCRLFRRKLLSFSFYKEPMGGGTAQSASPKNQEWIYPSPRSVGEGILNQVCSW